MRKKLIPIFLLINQREKRLNEDIKKFLGISEINQAQSKCLESLVISLKETTTNLINRIKDLQSEYINLKYSFILNGNVHYVYCRII